LATVGYISPLLGLLGTVMGMIEAFIQISRSSGTAPVGDLAGGIWTALITTAAGLVVAIPCYVAYNYLVTVMQSMIADMERAGIEVIHVLTEPSAQDVIVRMDGEQSGPAASKTA
jgi:biopolymer transport protein ExbB